MQNFRNNLKRIGDKMEFDMEYNLANGKIIGQGSFGSVYRCVSEDDSKEWAVKIIEVPNREEYKGSAEHEMNIFLLMDSHPNIIGIKKIYTWTNDLTHKFASAIVQELADKGLYDEYIERKKANNPFSEDEILNYLKQSVDGLYFIMSKNGIYHRDIKTENILLKNNQIKITDFGVSKSIQTEKIRTLQANTITGTPLFLSPKLWEGYIKRSELNVIHDLQKSDIFSLGLVFLQITLLLSNPEVAGLNQNEGDKKLVPLLNKIKSNKLKTILASMLVFDELKRADYITILKYFSMKETDFTNTSINQYIYQPPQKTPIFINSPNPSAGYRVYEPTNNGLVSDKINCSKHMNKQIEYFCEYENCYEGLCSECKITHSVSHMSKVLAYKLAISKYIDQNVLSQSYSKLNSTINNDIKSKISKYQSIFKEEIQKTGQELRKQILQTIDNTINKWSQDIENRLQNANRDAELAHLQVKNEEKILIDNQQKFKSSPSNQFYLQFIAKSQSQFETNISSATEKASKVQSDIQNLFKIESMYQNAIMQSYSFSRGLQQTFDQFFSDLILQINDKPSQAQFNNQIGNNNVLQIRGLYSPSSNQNIQNGINNQKNSNFLNVINPSKQSNYVQGQPIRNRSSDSSFVDRFSNFFSNPRSPMQKEPAFTAKKEGTSPKNSQFSKQNLDSSNVEFTPLLPSKKYYTTINTIQELIFIEQTKQKQLLLATQNDGKIIKINLQNEEKSEIELNQLKPKCSLYLPSSKRIVCGTVDGKVFIFDPLNMKVLDTFRETQNSTIVCMATFEKKQQILTGSTDGQVVLWNLEKKIQERVYQRLHQGEVRSIITNYNDAHMITVSTDKSIVITDLMTNRTIFTKQNAHFSSIVALKKIKENQFFTAGADGYVKLWEWKINDLTLLGENRVHNSPISFLDYYSKFDLIVTSSTDGVIHFTDPTNYTQIASAQVELLKGGAKGIHWSKPFLYTCDNNTIQKWDNPKFVSNLRIIKRKVRQKGQNCNIF